MNKVEKVFPSEEELSLVSREVRCSAQNCSAIFKSTSNLNMHLIRHHKVSGEELRKKEGVRQFYCPIELCIYHKDSNKHFKKLKYLKQHFLKVHAVRNFVCNKCDKKFATETLKNIHIKNCGSSFHCTCGSVYNSTEALLTHCRRKGRGHLNLKTKSMGKNINTKLNVKTEETDKNENAIPKKSERFICPKLSSDISYPIHYIAAVALSELSTPCNLSKVMDKSIQTEFYSTNLWKDLKKNASGTKSERKQNSSQETQTIGKLKNMKKSAETQTNINLLKHKVKSPSKTSCSKKRKKSMETQTKEFLNIVVVNNNKCNHKSKILFKNTLDSNSKKGLEFINNADEVLVDDLFEDISSNYLKDSDCLNNGKLNDKCSPTTNLNAIGQKSFLSGDELFSKRTRIDLLSNTSNRHELFNSNSDLNICGKDFDSDLNELNPSNKKLTSENENLYLMEAGSYSVFDINKLCNIETQTEIDNFLTGCNNDSTFTLCSTTETQTTDFDPLLYSNMCTQTCDEVDQLFNFNFVDIETQTAWPDL